MEKVERLFCVVPGFMWECGREWQGSRHGPDWLLVTRKIRESTTTTATQIPHSMPLGYATRNTGTGYSCESISGVTSNKAWMKWRARFKAGYWNPFWYFSWIEHQILHEAWRTQTEYTFQSCTRYFGALSITGSHQFICFAWFPFSFIFMHQNKHKHMIHAVVWYTATQSDHN